MLKSSFLGAITAAGLALAGGPALAQSAGVPTDIFTAYAIPVDAEAATAAAARDIALLKGQREGLSRVLKRLTLAGDWTRLPKVTDRQISALVSGIQVEDEKTSSTRYLANLIVEFKKDDIRNLLRFSRIPFTETRARPSLVLPVLVGGSGPLLFTEDNPWLIAWATQELTYGAIFPLLLPLGDLEDVAAIDGEQALVGNEEELARIAQRYGATNVVVAAATMVNRGGRPSIDLALNWHGPLKSGTESASLRALEGEETEALMARLAARTVVNLQEQWKARTVLRFDIEQQLIARVVIADLHDWVAVRQRLERNGMVRSYEIASISQQSVQLNISYLGEPDQLVVSLAQDNLALTGEDGGWVITLRSEAGRTVRE